MLRRGHPDAGKKISLTLPHAYNDVYLMTSYGILERNTGVLRTFDKDLEQMPDWCGGGIAPGGLAERDFARRRGGRGWN